MKIKVCGMRDPDNIAGIAALKPDCMGFIFYPDSPRYAGGMAPEALDVLSSETKRVGVFVNASMPEILYLAERYSLDMIQLHGDETPGFCTALRHQFPVIKAFGIASEEDFDWVAEYAGTCDYFLFDTKTALRGGSGIRFDHQVLAAYKGETNFFLSGGVELKDAENKMNINSNCVLLDINSRFENSPGLKDIAKVADFITTVRKNN